MSEANYGRFAAFSFVDEIISDEVGKAIVGKYFIPEQAPDFRQALCCEAVGQCAALSAMAAQDFQYQPVAGITRSVDFLAEANPGDVLDLQSELTRCDELAVTYKGVASVDGKEVVALHGCLGPMSVSYTHLTLPTICSV